MHLITQILFVLLTASPVVLAAPHRLLAPTPHTYIARTKVSEHNSNLTKRVAGGVKLSTGVNFTGSVDYVVWPLNTCINLND
jgi:hypothetical protein